MATYYPITGGGNWATAGTWNTSANQSTGNAPNAPLATDDVILDQYGGAVTVDTNTCVCKTLTANHANANLTISSAKILAVSGNITFITGMTLSGIGNLRCQAAGTLKSDGLTLPFGLNFNTTGIVKLDGACVVDGLVTFLNSTSLQYNSSTSETLTCNGGLTNGNTGSSPNTKIILKGSGKTWTCTSYMYADIDIDCTSLTITNIYYRKGVLNYIAGDVSITGGLYISQSCSLLTDNGSTRMTIPVFTLGIQTLTCTLLSNLTVGDFTNYEGNNLIFTFAGAYNITCDNLGGIHRGGGGNLIIPSGQTLTITTSLTLGNTVNYVSLIKASTPSSSAYLVYSGTVANCKIFMTTFTDIDASGSAQGLDNWYGGTLTRCSGITNRTSADIGGGGSSDVFGIIG